MTKYSKRYCTTNSKVKKVKVFFNYDGLNSETEEQRTIFGRPKNGCMFGVVLICCKWSVSRRLQ